MCFEAHVCSWSCDVFVGLYVFLDVLDVFSFLGLLLLYLMFLLLYLCVMCVCRISIKITYLLKKKVALFLLSMLFNKLIHTHYIFFAICR